MQKVKLSDLITYYKEKCIRKDDFFKSYFEEKDVEKKLSTLELMYKVLGDVVLPLEYFKVFLYSGHWYGDESYFKLTTYHIQDIYDIISKYDDMPISIIDSLIFHYDKEIFDKYQVKEYFDRLVSKYRYEEKTLKILFQYIEDAKTELREIFAKEAEKLEFIKGEYPFQFISILRDLIIRDHIEFDKIMEILPPADFFKATSKSDSKFYAQYTDYRFIFELLKGTIILDDYEDDDHIVSFEEIGQGERGIEVRKKKTSFTKKEYLDKIGKVKIKRRGE